MGRPRRQREEAEEGEKRGGGRKGEGATPKTLMGRRLCSRAPPVERMSGFTGHHSARGSWVLTQNQLKSSMSCQAITKLFKQGIESFEEGIRQGSRHGPHGPVAMSQI